jgi:hypothetical protein
LKKHLYICFYLSILLLPNLTYGQLIHGRIVDRITKEPLTFASIKIGYRGVISSNDGFFKITIREIDREKNNQLKISFIGFKTQEINLKSIKDNLIIEMESIEKQLDEVKITNGAVEIIKKAIRNFKINYSNKPYAMFGTQSETLEDQNQNKIYHLTSELKSIMPKFSSDEKIKIELNNLNIEEFKKADSSNFTIWGATGRAIEFFDFSNNSYAIFDSTKLKRFRFIVEEIMHENRPVYKISFSPKKNRENSYESYLMIDKVKFAIITLQIEAINSNSLWAILHQSKWKINYKAFGDKWYFKSLIHEHKSRSWTSQKEAFEILKLEIQIDKIDTMVNFDIDYANNIQKDDVLYFKAQKKLALKDSTQHEDVKPRTSKQLNRFVKFWYYHISIGKTLSITPLNSSSNSFDLRFTESKWQLDYSYQIQKKTINPILIGFSCEIKVGKAIKAFYDGSTNFGLGGRKINYTGLGLKFEKIYHQDKRPYGIYVSPQFGIIAEKIPIQGLQSFTSAQYKLMNLKEEPIQLIVSKGIPLLSIAFGYSYEISRKKHLNFELRYNYASKEANSLLIKDPTRSIFLGQNRILTSNISNQPLSNLNFSIKLF